MSPEECHELVRECLDSDSILFPGAVVALDHLLARLSAAETERRDVLPARELALDEMEAIEARLLCETWTKADVRLLLASNETLARELVAAEVRVEALSELSEEAELAVLALVPLLPLHGSWNSGYELTETVQTTLHATPEEWGTAAFHVANLQRLIPARAALSTGQRVTHGRHCPCSACKREDWTRITAPCGMHGESCPAVYAPLSAGQKEQQ